MESVRVIHNISKEYSQMIKIIIYKEPKLMVSSDNVKRPRVLVDEEDYRPSVSSLFRTKILVQDLVLCNNFDLFCTFTFDPAKIKNREDFRCCWLKMSSWLHHQKDKSTEKGKRFEYLIIPEQHKNGGWHFHALISGYSGALRDSKHKTVNGRPIFNITSFRSGFTTAVAIDDKVGVSSYITKYITKDFIKKYNQRRFFCSRGLNRPKRTINSSVLKNTLPLFVKKTGETESFQYYLIDKTLNVDN